MRRLPGVGIHRGARSGQAANAGGMATPGSQQDFVVNVGDRVFFESDQTELSPQAIATLEKQAQWLQTYNRYSFTIEGHADERGSPEYNIALGDQRAKAVAALLKAQGASDGQLTLVSYGEEKPAVFGGDESSFERNRRVEMQYQR